MIADWCDANGQPDKAASYRKTAESAEEARHYWIDTQSDSARAVWIDRLKTSGIYYRDKKLKPASKAVVGMEKLVADYLQVKRLKAESGQISVGRWNNARRWLEHWLHHSPEIATYSPSKLSGKQLEEYEKHLLELVAKKEFVTSTAASHMLELKMFYWWLWRKEIIATLPRDFKDYRITIKKPKVKTIPLDYIKTLIQWARPREKLFILLMLNTGYTQKDLADLRHEEVDLEKGIITRKRSKTGDKESTPEVCYPLWKETLRLLKQHADRKSEWVLTNDDGGKLLTESINKNDKYAKSDNVAVIYYRLCNRLKEKKLIDRKHALKLIRKTSSTLLKYSPYSGFAVLFLGHSPRGVADTSYFGEANFTEAIKWLGSQYGVE
jgi:integrase